MKYPAATTLITTLTLATALGLVSLGNTVQARERGWRGFDYDALSKLVQFRDLDLAEPAEARQLLQRVESASRKVCRRNHEMRDLQAAKDRDACVRASYTAAIADINRAHRVDLEAVAGKAATVAAGP
jgi:UrcA family protein